jgi:hypothetical protein
MAITVGSNPQIVEQRLSALIDQQLPSLKLLPVVMGLPELEKRQCVPDRTVYWSSEPSVTSLSEGDALPASSDFTFTEADVSAAKYAVKTIMSNEFAEDMISSDGSSGAVSTLMKSHVRGLVDAANSWFISELVSNLPSFVNAAEYPALAGKAFELQEDGNPKVSIVCSPAAYGDMMTGMLTAGGGFNPGCQVFSVSGFEAPAVSTPYAFAGDLSSVGRYHFDIRSALVDQDKTTALAENDQVMLVSIVRCHIAVPPLASGSSRAVVCTSPAS